MNAEAKSKTSAKSEHLRGSVLLVAGRVVAILVNFGVQVLTVRYLSKGDYGLLAYALSIAGILAILNAFSTGKATSRYLAVYLDQEDFSRFWGMLSLMFATVIGLSTIGILAFTGCWALGIPLFSSEANTQLVLAVIAGLAFCNAMDALFIALFAVLASPTAVFVRRHLVGPLLRLAAAVAVVLSGGNVLAFAVGQLVAGVLGLVLCIWMLCSLISRRADLLAAAYQSYVFPVRELFSYGATLLGGELSLVLRTASVPVLLGILFADEQVAKYQSVVPIARLNEFILVSFSVLFLPSAAKLAAASKTEELQQLYDRSSLWTAILSFPIFALSFVAADQLPVLLFGEEYYSSGGILALLALGYYANAAFGTSLRLLRATGTLSSLLFADLILLVISFALVCFLVPVYGATGGAWAVCGMYFAQSLVYLALVAKKTDVNPFTLRCLMPFFVGLGLCLAGAYVGRVVDAQILMSVVVSAIMTLLFLKYLDVAGTFPEIMKLPFLRRWRSSTAKDASP